MGPTGRPGSPRAARAVPGAGSTTRPPTARASRAAWNAGQWTASGWFAVRASSRSAAGYSAKSRK